MEQSNASAGDANPAETLSTAAGEPTSQPDTAMTSRAPSPAPASAAASIVANPLPSALAPTPQPAAKSIREDQVQNAVGFLSHPQVRSSTNTASKRSFLERKGLTAEEIDEAFRRVPEAPAPAAPPPAQPIPHVSPQPAAPVQQQQPVLPQQHAPGVPAAQPGSQLVPAYPGASALQAPQGYRWSQVVLGVGVVAAAGWAVHQLVVPRLRAMVESWQAARREAEETRQKALTTALDSLKGCQEELKASTQVLAEAVALMREQQQRAANTGADSGGATRGTAPGRYPGASQGDNYYTNGASRGGARYGNGNGNGNGNGDILAADNYASLRAAAGYTNSYPPDTMSYGYGRDSSAAAAGPTGGDGGRPGGGAPIYSVPSQSSQSFGAIRTAATGPYGGVNGGQAQESLPYRVTAPPSPAATTQSGRHQPPPTQSQPPVGYGGMGVPYGSSDRLYDASYSGAAGSRTADGEGSGSGRTVPRAPPEQPAYPQSFHEVMEMVQKGITPPNVRTDINDSPPDPTRPLSEPRMAAPAKPWERSNGSAATAGGTGGIGGSSALYGMSSVPSATPRSNSGMSGWGSSSVDASMGTVSSPPLPPPAYGMPYASMASGGAGVGFGGNAVASGVGAGAAGRSSNSGGGSAGGGGSSTGLSVLPPPNPTWKPPPPPTRTVTPSNPPSPPSVSGTGMASAASAPVPAASAAVSLTADAADVARVASSILPPPASGPGSSSSPGPAAVASLVPAPAAAAGGIALAAGGPVVGPQSPGGERAPQLAAASGPAPPNLRVNAGAGAGLGAGMGADMAPTSPTPSQPPFAPSGGELVAREAFSDVQGPEVDAPAAAGAGTGAGQTVAAAGDAI